MSDINKIVAYFEENEPDLVPVVKLICREMPELEDVFDIEELANYVILCPGKRQDRSIRELYQIMHYDDRLYTEALMQGDAEDLSSVVTVDTGKTAEAVSEQINLTDEVCSLLDEDESFTGITLSKSAQARMLSLNLTAHEFCRAADGFSVEEEALAHKDSPNACLYLDAAGSNFFLMSRKLLSLWSKLLSLSDDFGIAKTAKGFRLSFGIQGIWDKFKN